MLSRRCRRLVGRRALSLASAFANLPQPAKEAPETGLFGNPALRQPNGIPTLNERVRNECLQLVEESCHPKRSRKMVQVMDDMSNSICCAADLIECVRLLHPDEEWRTQAEASMGDFTELVETLNTTRPLYEAMAGAVDEEPFDAVDSRVAHLFVEDFQASGVHLPEKQRQEFVELSRDIFDFGANYMVGANRPALVLKDPPDAAKHYLRTEGAGLLRKGSQYLEFPLSEHPDPELRRWGYQTYYAPSQDQENCLKSLLVARSRLARLTGFETFAHRAQKFALLDHPDQIHNFLSSLISALRPISESELSQVASKSGASVPVWDYSYLTGQHRSRVHNLSQTDFKGQFRVGPLMETLGVLFRRLYGLRLTAVPAAPGELWHPSVIKIEVSDENGNRLGHIYCDFFHRDGKLGGDSHFTIRCSKLLSDASYQSPLVVLSLSFSEGGVLSPSQAENLFHEMGHAIHSMLARTKYQHVSGTRCSTDLAETPSNLMERFFYDPRVLATVCAEPGKEETALGMGLADALCSSVADFAATDIIQQASYALLDLELHSMGESQLQSLDTVTLFRDMQRRHLPLLEQPSMPAWHHRFSHLVTYGAKYQSYLVAKSLSYLIYSKLFADDPFSRASGAAWAKAQSAGGEQPTGQLLASVLGYEVEPLHLVEAIHDLVKR